MRLAFLCSSLEPGRDGVGDYTRRLAGELIRQGHECVILALNDKGQTNAETLKTEKLKGKVTGQISEVSSEKAESEKAESGKRKAESGSKNGIADFIETHRSEGTDVECLRLPESLGWRERSTLARQWLKKFNPDWASLQYVCYGFHPKGLAWRWNSFFAELGRMAKHRHLMFHELWIDPPPFHRWLMGLGQQRVISHLHRRFRPEVVTTSMTFYQRRLSGLGIKGAVLPLFGNIPLVHRDDKRIAGLLSAAGSRMVQQPRNTFLNGVFFGTIHPDFNVALLIKWLVELQKMSARTVLLSMIGRIGPGAEALAKQLVSALPDAVEVVLLGEQPEATISQALQFADFGINTGSTEYLGKSGTFAAMREHGLPVVLSDGMFDSVVLQSTSPPVLQFSTNDSVGTVINHSRLLNPRADINPTAVDLIQLLKKAVYSARTNNSPLMMISVKTYEQKRR